MTRVCGSLQASLRPIVSGSHVSPVSADHVHRICHLTPWTTTKSSIYNFIFDHNWSPWPYWRSFEPPHLIVSAGQSLRANDDVQYNIQDDLRWTLQHYNITRAENLMNRLVFKCRSRLREWVSAPRMREFVIVITLSLVMAKVIYHCSHCVSQWGLSTDIMNVISDNWGPLCAITDDARLNQ